MNSDIIWQKLIVFMYGKCNKLIENNYVLRNSTVAADSLALFGTGLYHLGTEMINCVILYARI